MSLLELVMLGVVGLITVGIAVFLGRRGGRERDAVTRPPVPRKALIPALITILLGVVISLVAGNAFTVWVLQTAVSDLPANSSLHFVANDLTVAWFQGTGLLTLWLTMPGASFAARLLLSSERSPKSSAIFAITIWIGFGLGMILALQIVRYGLPLIVEGARLQPTFTALHVTRATVLGMFGLGCAVACVPGIWILSASSSRALRRTTRATIFLPLGALGVATVVTPPDIWTQLMVAGVIVACWLIGLAAGSITVLLRRRRSAPRCPNV